MENTKNRHRGRKRTITLRTFILRAATFLTPRFSFGPQGNGQQDQGDHDNARSSQLVCVTGATGVNDTSVQFSRDSSGESTDTRIVKHSDPCTRVREKQDGLIRSSGESGREESMEIPFFTALERQQNNLLSYREWMLRERMRVCGVPSQNKGIQGKGFAVKPSRE